MAPPQNPASKIGKGNQPVLPPAGQQWTQAQVKYEAEVAPGGCGQCRYYLGQRMQCALVSGTIKSYGCCDLFDTQDPPPPPVSKYDAGYVEAKGASFQCGDCAFFASPDGCQIVQGTISPTGVCVEWAPAEKVGPDAVNQAVADETVASRAGGTAKSPGA